MDRSELTQVLKGFAALRDETKKDLLFLLKHQLSGPAEYNFFCTFEGDLWVSLWVNVCSEASVHTFLLNRGGNE